MQERRRTRTRATAVALAVLAATAGAGWWGTRQLDGPMGMLPGGPFAGPASPCDGVRWAGFAAVPQLELEVQPDSPRSITTWSVVHAGELFIPADFLTPWKRWPQQVLDDDRIRLRIRGRIFECRAERVLDESLIEALRLATATKYDLEPGGRAAAVEVWWFRVQPR